MSNAVERIRHIRETYKIGLTDARREVKRQDLIRAIKSGNPNITDILLELVNIAIPSRIGD